MLIDGKKYSLDIKNEVKKEIENLKKEGQRIPKLTVIIIGNNSASQTYVKNKIIACNYVGMLSNEIRKDDISEEELVKLIDSLNKDDSVDGILVQLPLPNHINEEKIISAISPEKDVDGFHPSNVAKLFLNQKSLHPCTPQGIIYLLEKTTELTGKNVVMVGRSNIVGKPLSLMCLHKNATVTMAHSKTSNLKEICRNADIVITAIGKAKFFTKEYFNENSIVIDVGMNRDENNKLCGDVDPKVRNFVKAITPVPGGVGPMTIAMLMKNTLESYYNR